MSTEAYKTGYIDGAANELHYKQRCEQLEQLCRDLWTCAHEPKCCNCPKYQGEDTNCEVLNAQRMDALGLLGGDSFATKDFSLCNDYNEKEGE